MKRPVLIQKYGGSSLAQPSQIRAIADRILALHNQGFAILVVVSAMGKTTDQLLALAYDVSQKPNRRELDMLLSTGERVSMALVSMALNDRGCSAISFTGSQAGVLTDESHSNARILEIKPTRIDMELAKGNIVVLAGFQGVSPRTKEITTLGRGGSDVTAVAMAAHFKAERCEIRKDVEGVFSCDPNLAPGKARHLPHLHYDHLLEMSYFGAKVLHYRSVELAKVMSIPILIGLSHGEGRTTLIDQEAKMFEQMHILSVNSHTTARVIEVHEPELGKAFNRLSSALQTAGLPLPQVLDTEKSMKVVATSADGSPVKIAWNFLITAPAETLTAITSALSNHEFLSIEPKLFATVTATCQGAFASALPQQILMAVENRGIKVQKLMFSPLSVTLLVSTEDREKVIPIIHDLQGKTTQAF